jgi:hypothetical protein
MKAGPDTHEHLSTGSILETQGIDIISVSSNDQMLINDLELGPSGHLRSVGHPVKPLAVTLPQFALSRICVYYPPSCQ